MGAGVEVEGDAFRFCFCFGLVGPGFIVGKERTASILDRIPSGRGLDVVEVEVEVEVDVEV